jgi:uncharacterized protein (DUF1684 family)
MSPMVAEELSLIERRTIALREAVALGDERKVDRAARSLERARNEESESKKTRRAHDKAHAYLQVNAERQAKADAERRVAADKIEAVLRETGLPYAIVHTGTGQAVRVDLSRTEQVERQTAAEALKRVALRVSQAYLTRRTRTRNTLTIVPAEDVITPMLENSSDLLQAHRFGVVEVK